MKNFALIVGVLLVGSLSQAGDNGGGRIDCSSDSGRTTVRGAAGAPYNGVGPAALVYSIDGKEITLDSSVPASEKYLLVDFVNYSHKKSYSVIVKRVFVHHSSADGKKYVYNESVFQMNSTGAVKNLGGDRFSFKAVIPAHTSVDPRKVGDLTGDAPLFDQDIAVNCVLDVSI